MKSSKGIRNHKYFFRENNSFRNLERSLKRRLFACILNIKLSLCIRYFFGGCCTLRTTIPKDPTGSFTTPFPENSITVAACDPFRGIQRRYFAQTALRQRLTWPSGEKSINTEYCVVTSGS